MKIGTYTAKVKCADMIEAMCNGFATVYPEATMKYDGRWCYFYKGKKKVFESNPDFAKFNFDLKFIKTPNH